MVVLKYTTMELGAPCAMIPGISKMLMWFVVSWVSPEQNPLYPVQGTVKVLSLRGWMMSTVMEQRLHCLIVRTTGGERRTVATLRMQV